MHELSVRRAGEHERTTTAKLSGNLVANVVIARVPGRPSVPSFELGQCELTSRG